MLVTLNQASYHHSLRSCPNQLAEVVIISPVTNPAWTTSFKALGFQVSQPFSSWFPVFFQEKQEQGLLTLSALFKESLSLGFHLLVKQESEAESLEAAIEKELVNLPFPYQVTLIKNKGVALKQAYGHLLVTRMGRLSDYLNLEDVSYVLHCLQQETKSPTLGRIPPNFLSTYWDSSLSEAYQCCFESGDSKSLYSMGSWLFLRDLIEGYSLEYYLREYGKNE